MEQEQKNLLIDTVIKYFGEKDTEFILTEYNLTGPDGLRRMLGEMDDEYFCKAFLADQFDREFGEYAGEILGTLSKAIDSDKQENIAIVAPREHGKALEANTLILTSKGWKTHANLNVGDFVYNNLGNQVKVLNVQKPYMHQCMKLTLDTKDSFVCSNEHEWIVEINRDKRVDNKRNGKRIGRQTEILETQNIYKGYQVDSPAIRLPEALDNYDIELPIDPYLLGVWLGDGHSGGSRISCGKDDLEHFRYLGNVTKASSCYCVTSKGLVTLLREYNLYKNKHIPEIYFNASKKQRLELLKGLMDTDGTVNTNRAQCAFTNINKKLIDDVLILCRSLNIKAKIREKDAKIYGRYISKAYEVGFTASRTDKIFNLKRKQSRIDSKTKIEHIDKKRYFIKEIVDVEDALVNCISVEGGIYLAGRGLIPTHNSTLCTFALPTKSALYKKKEFVLFISANADMAANFLEKTKKALQNPEIVQDFGNQKGKIWNADNICLKNGTWIACTGWKSGIRGINKDTRPDLVICDDLEDKMTMESDSMRLKLENCFKEEIGRLGYYKTDMFYIGTLLSNDSLLAKVIKDPSWQTLFYKCVLSFPDDEKLWEQWREIYRDLNNDNRKDESYEFYLKNKNEMLKGTKVLWEGRFPESKMEYKGDYYNIMLMREKFGEDAFWKEDQNEPRSGTDKKFKQITYWDKLPEIKTLKLAIDPSEGKGDSTAYVCGGEHNEGCYVKDGQLKLHDPYELMEHVVWYIKEYPDIDEVLLESNLFKDLLKSELIKKLCENDCYRTVTHNHASENKYIRIMKMEPDIVSGKVLFNELNVQFNEQVKDFSKTCKHDDAPDGLQILWKKLKTPNYYMK